MATEAFLIFTHQDGLGIVTRVDRVPAVRRSGPPPPRPAASVQTLSWADRIIGIDGEGRYTYVWKDRYPTELTKRLVEQSKRTTKRYGGTPYDSEAFK